MEEHAEALEADLLRYYGVDLLDWHRGALSSRRLAVLVRHLPPDSAFVRAREGEAAEWGLTDHLLAAVVDHLAIANWMFASVNRDEYADPPETPVPVPRPAAGTATAPETRDTGPPDGPGPAATDHAPSAAELARFFG
ncbi:hypothetical protein [Streptomyces cuspidosporus]|uniref:hypothetical protein n=1 Tax=Streptomyces cuspidosporus TaxID=66882 RepID=UPI0031FDE01D